MNRYQRLANYLDTHRHNYELTSIDLDCCIVALRNMKGKVKNGKVETKTTIVH